MDNDIAQRIGRLADEATAIGINTSALRAIDMSDGQLDYAAALPALSDLADALAGLHVSDGMSFEIDALLRHLRTSETGPPRDRREEFDALPRDTYGTLKAEYLDLFATCVVRPERASVVDWHVRKLLAGQHAYQRVGARLAVPWYFIGIAHGLEASFRFNCHLHNGDPLSARTVQYPSGRPLVWNPPSDWDSSALDAMTFEGFANKPDWSLPRTLYRWEAYNGFGSRARGIHTPYLWSFSNHYDKGKYVADRVWNPNVISKQCGAAVMLKALVNGGHTSAPPIA